MATSTKPKPNRKKQEKTQYVFTICILDSQHFAPINNLHFAPMSSQNSSSSLIENASLLNHKPIDKIHSYSHVTTSFIFYEHKTASHHGERRRLICEPCKRVGYERGDAMLAQLYVCRDTSAETLLTLPGGAPPRSRPLLYVSVTVGTAAFTATGLSACTHASNGAHFPSNSPSTRASQLRTRTAPPARVNRTRFHSRMPS